MADDIPKFDMVMETARRRVRNDPVFHGMVSALRNMMMDNNISELDIVAAARLASEELEQVRLERYWRENQYRSIELPTVCGK